MRSNTPEQEIEHAEGKDPASPGDDWSLLERMLGGEDAPAGSTPDLARIAADAPERFATMLSDPGRADARVARLVAASAPESLRRLIAAHSPAFAARDLVAIEVFWEALPRETGLSGATRAGMWQFAVLAAFGTIPPTGGIGGLARAALAFAAPDGPARAKLLRGLSATLSGMRSTRAPAAPALLLSGLRGLPGAVAAPSEADPVSGSRPDFTRSAGLVLLAPYLPMLFSRLDLVRDGAFRSEVALQTGMDALHTLVWAEATAEPDTLPLERLICGVPEGVTLRPPAPLADTQACALVESLLEAVIAQWSALGQTSPAGLRTSFLQRDGLLEQIGQGHRLDVSPRPFDMLLDRLPWSVALVKLPWMDVPVHVKWRET